MKSLFALFWQICLLRKGPQDVPYAPVLLVFLLLAELALGITTIAFLGEEFRSQQIMGNLLAVAAWFAFVWMLLSFKSAQTRFVQTMTACIGTDLLMSLIILPLQVYLISQPEVGSGVRVVMLVVLIWDILIKGRIYASALSIGQFQANLLSITLWLVLLLLSNSLLPPEALESLQESAQQASSEQTPTSDSKPLDRITK